MNTLIKRCHDFGSFHLVINMKLLELQFPLSLLICLGYYIFSQFNLYGNIVQLFLLNVAMTNALHSFICILCIYIYVYIYVVL